MTSRERVERTLNHEEPDRVPLDLGGTMCSGMHASSVYRLRRALGLDPSGTPVKVVEPYQMLGEIAPDLMEVLGVDVASLSGPATMFGFRMEGWKPWTLFDGTPVLVPGGFNTDPEPNGDILLYPEGDRSAPPSGRMPKDGFYFDAIVRQPPIKESELSVEDNLEEFRPISDADLAYLRTETDRLYAGGKAVFGNFGGTSFGDIALVPGMMLKHPKGIRDIAEWYTSVLSRADYIRAVFEGQCEIALSNLAKIHGAVGDRICALFVSGADFGTQQGPFISPETYREMFLPFHIRVNNWIHEHTTWKTLVHSCGAVRAFLDSFIEAGFDILNPVQCSAAGMDPIGLKRDFGDRIVFWGGGVDTQRTLPFGTPEEVKAEVRERIRVFAPGGGFMFNTVHNVQARVPVENLLALYETVRECGVYPIRVAR